MEAIRSVCFLATLLPLAVGHGTLTKPVARQRLLGVGLTNPGAGQCDFSQGNDMNMNGCQGAGGVIDFQGNCWVACNGKLDSIDATCVTCKERVVSDYKNGGTVKPAPQLGACGDLSTRNAFSTNFDSNACKNLPGSGSCVEKALAQPFSELVMGADNSIEVELTITAHHWGWSEFRLCREGGLGRDGEGVTQECFNNDVLRFDAEHAKNLYGGDKMKPGLAGWSDYVPSDPSDYIGTHPSVRCDGPGDDIINSQKLEHPEIWAPEGSCCYNGGDCGNSNITKDQNVRWVFPNPSVDGAVYKIRVFLPPGLTCTQDKPCTLQWLFITGNSQSSYPEAFRNCADFKLVDETAGPAPTISTTTVGTTMPKSTSTEDTVTTTTTSAQAASPTQAPTLEPIAEPEPEPEPEPMPTQAPNSAGQACKANPSVNRGVTDSDCAKCETGYRWWPCNENSLCVCSNGLLQDTASDALEGWTRTSKRKQEFLGTDDVMMQFLSELQRRKESDAESGVGKQEL